MTNMHKGAVRASLLGFYLRYFYEAFILGSELPCNVSLFIDEVRNKR
jgi:hypothetical protein